jgi:hypothetical protein
MNDALKEALITRGFTSKEDLLTYNADWLCNIVAPQKQVI